MPHIDVYLLAPLSMTPGVQGSQPGPLAAVPGGLGVQHTAGKGPGCCQPPHQGHRGPGLCSAAEGAVRAGERRVVYH